MSKTEISHRWQGFGYVLVREDTDTHIMCAEELLQITNWGIEHKEELEKEAEAEREHNVLMGR